jgi:hypothetical protein
MYLHILSRTVTKNGLPVCFISFLPQLWMIQKYLIMKQQNLGMMFVHKWEGCHILPMTEIRNNNFGQSSNDSNN